MLDRGERIELLVDKTDRLADDAFTFRRSAVRLKHHIQLQHIKFWAAVGGGSILLLYFILAVSCGPKVNKC